MKRSNRPLMESARRIASLYFDKATSSGDLEVNFKVGTTDAERRVSLVVGTADHSWSWDRTTERDQKT